VASGSVGLVMIAFTVLVRPFTGPGLLAGDIRPDSYDYAYGAAALLHGSYIVDWDGEPRVPRYPPGFSVLLMPAVALGGVHAAVWVPYTMALGLAGLCALVAARLGRPIAAPIAALLTLFTPAVTHLAQLIMSDLPAATLVALEMTLLALGRGPASVLLAGVVAGGLSWIRLAAAPLVLAGLVATGARAGGRRGLVWYGVGAGLPLLGLAFWQLSTFGSPLTTSYQAAGASPGSADLTGFFSSTYAVGPPEFGDRPVLGGDGRLWRVPNFVFYLLQLLGLDGFLGLPGVGGLGVLGLSWLAGKHGAPAVVGRFGLTTVLLTLLVYVPYFWQSGRFLLVTSPVLAVASAVLLARALGRVSGFAHRRYARMRVARFDSQRAGA
jgi:hypothetical protein